RARLHEANLDPQVQRRRPGRHRPGGDRTRDGRGPRRPRPLGRDSPQPGPGKLTGTAMTATGTGGSDDSGNDDRCCRLVAVTLDEASLGRGNPDIDHERRVAIFDLLENNSFDV